ncbi:MAG: hypothetical protein Q9227_000798 [Pyrenula ochraceoflavens]
MRPLILRLLCACLLVAVALGWSKEGEVFFDCFVVTLTLTIDTDHEIFRLKDEVEAAEGQGVSFYDFVGIKSSATQEELNKAYRKKSKQIHPDKVKQTFIARHSTKKKPGSKKGVHVNKPPSQKEITRITKQASDRFSRLGVVINILRGPGRERYDHFLANGFPTWRGTGYYYKRYRPGIGTVLIGLFLVGGGAAHYAFLYLSWSQQRQFMEKYIREARKAAWGDETGVRGIPGLSGSTAVAPAVPDEEPPAAVAMNRRQKRLADKENRKEKKSGKASGRSGTATPVEGGVPSGESKRVVAENGKVMMVDSTGNVFLEEEDEDGNVQHWLLDLDEIQKPTIRDTAVFKLPKSIFNKLVSIARREPTADPEGPTIQVTVDEPGQDDSGSSGSFEMVGDEHVSTDMQPTSGKAKKRGKKASKK